MNQMQYAEKTQRSTMDNIRIMKAIIDIEELRDILFLQMQLNILINCG